MLELGLEGRRALVAGAGHRPPRPGMGGRRRSCSPRGAPAWRASTSTSVAPPPSPRRSARGGGEAIVVTADLTQRADATRAVAEVAEQFGGLDVVVDIIGEARWGSVLEFTDEDWEWSLGTNLRQAFLLLQAAAKQMVSQGTGGAMAVVSSVDSMFAATNHVGYGAAKAGLVNLVKTFAEELGQYRIRVERGDARRRRYRGGRGRGADLRWSGATAPAPEQERHREGIDVLRVRPRGRGERPGVGRRRRREHQVPVVHAGAGPRRPLTTAIRRLT